MSKSVQNCLDLLKQAEVIARKSPLQFEELIAARSLLLRLNIESRTNTQVDDERFSFAARLLSAVRPNRD
jgi:hypothetical protein